MSDVFLFLFAKLISIFRKIFDLELELNSKHKNLQMLLIKYFSSNHERRILLNHRLPLKKTSLNLPRSIDEKVDYNFFSHKKVILTKKKILLVYVGDSLIEYLSRVKINCNGYKNALAFWIGPKTRLGLTLDREMNSIQKSITDFVNEYTFNKGYEEVILVWSTGTIDVRCSIFELDLRGLISDESGFLNLYEDTTSNLIEKLIVPLAKSIKSRKVVLLSELDSSLNGHTPQSMKELKEIKLTDLYPSLGSPSFRKNWRKKLNYITEQQARKYNLQYININPYIFTQDKSKSTQFDGVHISDPDTIDIINKKIINII